MDIKNQIIKTLYNQFLNIKKIYERFTLKNLGKADITSHVNFKLLKEFFLKNNLKVKKIVTQKNF